MEPKGYYKQFFAHEENSYSVIIEDNGKVAYAYLLEGEEIIAEVWLYNNGESLYNDWDNLSNDDFPLQNLRFNISKQINTIKKDADVRLKWMQGKNLVKAFIHIHEDLIAVLKSDEKIGYSTIISVDSPIAKQH